MSAVEMCHTDVPPRVLVPGYVGVGNFSHGTFGSAMARDFQTISQWLIPMVILEPAAPVWYTVFPQVTFALGLSTGLANTLRTALAL